MEAITMIHQMAEQGYGDLGSIDHDAVDGFIADAAGQPIENLIKVRDRMVSMIQRREKARGTNLPTMAATADRLTEIINGIN